MPRITSCLSNRLGSRLKKHFDGQFVPDMPVVIGSAGLAINMSDGERTFHVVFSEEETLRLALKVQMSPEDIKKAKERLEPKPLQPIKPEPGAAFWHEVKGGVQLLFTYADEETQVIAEVRHQSDERFSGRPYWHYKTVGLARNWEAYQDGQTISGFAPSQEEAQKSIMDRLAVVAEIVSAEA